MTKVLAPDQETSTSRLSATYEHLGQSHVAVRDTRPERDPKDPFGFKNDGAPSDPFEAAKGGVEKMVNFFSLLQTELQLSNEAAIFMIELTAMNILNSNIPLSREKVMDARRKAHAYYQEGVKQLEAIEAEEKAKAAARRNSYDR